MRRIGFVLFSILLAGGIARAAEPDFLAGVDISMLPALEKAGAVYRQDGKPADAIAILRDHGCNFYRIRLFVNPDPVFNDSDGAIQDLRYVRDLAKRVKAAGGVLDLDLHFSDTWADPGKQFKPKAWKDLGFEELVRQVHDYTAYVLSNLAANDASPDMVQVGNEITPGMLWPDGRVTNAPPGQEDAQWEKFSRLLNAGAEAVRQASTADHKIRVVIHIDGGGKPGRAKWFFGKLAKHPVDFDVIGLSFYPAWGDSMDVLKQTLADVINGWGKDVFVAETSYPWREMPGIGYKNVMQWPSTPAGQRQFLRDLTDVIRAAPGHHGIGYAWWYPEAVPVRGLHIWRNGAEALFDGQGNPEPALDEFGARDP